MAKILKDFMFSQVSKSEPAKPFDGMAYGDFIDMYGRAFSFKKDELPQYVERTKAALESTRSESGEIVGMPIDTMNHGHTEAAGWIVDVQLSDDGERVLFTPRWNEIGIDLIGSDIVRFFSPNIDNRAKVITGGSLTNYPASRTREHKILLKPIELSTGFFALSDMSLEERYMKVVRSFYDEFGYDVDVIDVYDDCVICRNEGKLYRVSFSEREDETIEFAGQTEWVEVRQSYIEAAMQFLKSLFTGLTGSHEPEFMQAGLTVDPTEEPMDFDKLTPEQKSKLLAEAGAQLAANPNAELAAMIDAKANERAMALLAVEQRKGRISELAARLTGGCTEAPCGLPVDKAELEAFLSAPTAEKAEEILLSIQSKGLVSFSELGHNRPVTGRIDLPAEYAAKLSTGEFSLADLANPALALGDLDQYDLSKWKKEE